MVSGYKESIRCWGLVIPGSDGVGLCRVLLADEKQLMNLVLLSFPGPLFCAYFTSSFDLV